MKSAFNKTKNGLKDQTLNWMMASAFSAAIIGCAGGTNTNPVAKYEDVINNSVTQEQAAVTPSQRNSGYTPRIFVTPDEKGQRPELNFEEGKESSYSLSALLNDNVYVSGATYKVAAVGLPEGATLTQDPKNKEQYILKWKPAYSTVVPSQDKTTIKFALEIKDIKAPNEEMMGYIKNTKLSESFSINVAIDNKVPTVTSVVGLNDEYAEGKTYDISFTVADLGGHPSLLPSLVKVNRTFDCKEGQCYVDAAQYLNLAKVEDLKNGQWKMTLQLNLQQKAIDFASASNKLNAKGQEGAGFELSFKVQGGRGKFSSTVSKKGFIVYKSEAKKPIFSVPTGYVVPVGTNAKSTPTTFSLYSSVDTNRGKLAIDSASLTSAVMALSSTNKVACKYVGESKTSEVCNITFNFACGTKQTFPLTAKSAHNVNGGVQTAEVALRIQVSESADCKALADQKKAADMKAAADKAKADAAAKAKAAADAAAKAKADAAAKAAAGAKK